MDTGTLSESSGWKASYNASNLCRPICLRFAPDLVDLAASLMEWEHFDIFPSRMMKVVWLVVLPPFASVGEGMNSGREPVSVESIMKNPVSWPDTDTIDAIAMMRKSRVGCLPVMTGNWSADHRV